MIKLFFDVIIIFFILLGMIVLSKELYQHFTKIKPLAKDSISYKSLLFILGIYILSEKIPLVIQEFSH